MTSVTPTEISWDDFPSTANYGTPVRRSRVFVRATNAGGSTLNLTTYVPGAADVEGIVYETDDGAVSGTSATWSTSTLTFGTGVGGTYEGCFVVTYT